MNVFKQITILCLVVLAGSIIFCRKEVAASAVQDAPEPRTLVLIRRDPHMDEYYVQTVDVTWWEEGEDAVVLYCSQTDWVAIIPYPWSGEDTIIYNYDGDYLWIRTRPEDTTIYYSYCGYLVQGRIVGLSTSRYEEYSALYEPENILCLGGVSFVDLDSLKRNPNVTAIGISWCGACGSYLPLRFSNIEQVPKDIDLYFWSSELRNHDFPKLRRLSNLKGLVIYVNPWANKVLRHIGKMRNLRQLEIRYYSANDRKLRHLAKLKNLHTLTLDRFKISDRGLRHLGKIPSLRSLTLDNYQRHGFEDFLYWCDVFGVVYAMDYELTLWDHLDDFFYGLTRLIEIFPYAYGSMFVKPTTAEGWQNFAELPYLRELYLGQYHMELRNEDLEGIGSIVGLRRLELQGQCITDEGLKYLEGLKNLKELAIYSKSITWEGINRLQQALPECKIDHTLLYQETDVN